MGLSTTDLGGSGMVKTITPGNHTLKINNITLEDFTFKPGAKYLVMQVETKPIEGFEGFFIDKDDESKGKYAGQIGRVKSGQFAFADGITKTGVKIDRDKSILIFLRDLSKALGVTDWFTSQDGKHNTIEEFVEAFNDSKIYANVYIDFCIAGKEYTNKGGYAAFDMFLPKPTNNKYAFGSNVMDYNESIHLVKSNPQTEQKVDAFGTDDSFVISPKNSTDFQL